ncbi:MAG: S41 family peptidase [Saprospiraceae bacterium]
MKYYSIVFLLLFSIFGYSQKVGLQEKIYSTEELQEDFRALRKHIETNNPLAFVYHSRASIQQKLDSVEVLVNRPMTESEFYRLISPIASMTKDGHNLIMPSASRMKGIRKSPFNIPLNIRFLENKLVIIRNLSNDKKLKSGQIITAINGVSTNDIVHHLMKVLPQEGNQTEYPKHIIDTWFGYFYNLHYGFHKNYVIQSSDKNKTQESTIKGELMDTIYARKVERYPNSITPKMGIEVEVLNDTLGIALLTIPTFATSILKDRYNQKHFKKQINRCFDVIFQKNVQHLIIDVRSNGGGNPAFASHILKFLFDKKFEQAQEARVIKDASKDDFMARTTSKWFPWYGVGTFKPKRKNYKKNLYVLMNGGTFSSAVEFVTTLNKYNRATFIGSESGGNPIIMSGNYLKEMRKLPNTKITHYSGFICTIYDDLSLNTGRGLLPHHEVKLTINDVLEGKDKCLEKTLLMISAK